MPIRYKWTVFLLTVLMLFSGCTPQGSIRPADDHGPAGSLNCLEISRFTGGFVEDGSDAPVRDVAAILVANNTGKFLELATVTYKVGDRTATFKVTGLPQGKRAWVLESNRLTLSEGDELVLEDCRETYHPDPILSTDALSVSRQGNSLTLTNNSGRKLSNVAVYYKNTLEDGTFMGGISYLISFGDLEPGTAATRSADHFNDTSEIVRYSFQ